MQKPSLILGTVQFGMSYGINNSSGRPSLHQVQEMLTTAYRHDIRELDTAQGYGDAENVLRLAISPSEKFLIHSKFSLNDKFTTNEIGKLLSKTLENLGVREIGYFFFHKFSDIVSIGKLEEYELQYINVHSMGLAASIYTEDEFRFVLDCGFIKAIQLPYNVFDSSLAKVELMKIAKLKGIKLYCRSVFLQGLFFMNPAELPTKLRPFEQPLLALRELSLSSGYSIMDLALGCAKNRTELSGVLIGVDTKEQLLANLKAWNTELSSTVLDKLSELDFKHKELLLPKNWN